MPVTIAPADGGRYRAAAPSARAAGNSHSGSSPATRDVAATATTASAAPAGSIRSINVASAVARIASARTIAARAVAADAAVAHDLKAALDGLSAAEAVGGVGQAVFVQRARNQDERGDGQQCREQRREIDCGETVKDNARYRAEHRACDRDGGRRPGEIRCRVRCRFEREHGERQARIKTQRRQNMCHHTKDQPRPGRWRDRHRKMA